MNSKVFVDSSVLIEFRKGNNVDFLPSLLAAAQLELCVSQIIASEYLFHLLAIFSGKSPLSVKMAGEVNTALQKSNPEILFSQFNWIPDNLNFFSPAVHFMSTYNLLPNDALILTGLQTTQYQRLGEFRF